MDTAEFYAKEPTGSQAYGAPRPNNRIHTGDDYSHSIRPDTVPVPYVRAGVVVSIQRDRPNLPNGYGNQVRVRHDDGSAFTYSHLGRITAHVGQEVTTADSPGTEGSTGWTSGSCVHVEYFNPKGSQVDPGPAIRAALAGGGAPASTTPAVPTPTIPLEEDLMRPINFVDKYGSQHKCVVGPGIFRHLVEADPADWIRNVVSADDTWTEVKGEDRLKALLRTYGCDLDIYKIIERVPGVSTTLQVLDPLTGQYREGGVWTAANVARAAIAKR